MPELRTLTSDPSAAPKIELRWIDGVSLRSPRDADEVLSKNGYLDRGDRAAVPRLEAKDYEARSSDVASRRRLPFDTDGALLGSDPYCRGDRATWVPRRELPVLRRCPSRRVERLSSWCGARRALGCLLDDPRHVAQFSRYFHFATKEIGACFEPLSPYRRVVPMTTSN
ncbi:MAG TPA: hypothetical protein VND89_03830 [Acidimicrobiales bacterium]|nr:hypothetical protein [Acidimicrobiales bacterium]